MKKIFYPAVFQREKDDSFTVTFPDIDGAITSGENMEEAYEMAFECLGLVLSHLEENKESIPMVSNPEDIALKKGQYLMVVEFDVERYQKANNNKAIKKTLSIPSWMNEAAMRKGINFSAVLQNALKKELNV
ncbi:MAG: type II toxin-antitoxin system HicB family antitoxin [Anaerovoracaceae bacterium]